VAQIVFIHGAADSGAVWEKQAEFLAPRHDVLALDLPGHGVRLAEQPLETVAAMAQEVLSGAQTRGMARPVLVGHSMGGATALQLALDAPSSVAALVLVGTGAKLRIRDELVERARQVAESAPPDQIVERIVTLSSAVSPSASLATREWLRQRIGQSTGRAVHADFRATSDYDQMARIAEIDLLTLIIAGEDDQWTPSKFQHYLAERIRRSRLVMLPNAGHYPFVEQADRFNDELERFLNYLASGPQ
jgi:pimeloyl-ACP methyl ester carboxylesterase